MAGASPSWRLHPDAPPSGCDLGPLDETPDNRGREFVFGRGRGAFRMLVVRRGPLVFGYVNQCPHFSLPLNHEPDDFMTADGARIRCTRHFAVFRVEDGFCEAGACERAFLEPVPVETRDGRIVVS